MFLKSADLWRNFALMGLTAALFALVTHQFRADVGMMVRGSTDTAPVAAIY